MSQYRLCHLLNIIRGYIIPSLQNGIDLNRFKQGLASPWTDAQHDFTVLPCNLHYSNYISHDIITNIYSGIVFLGICYFLPLDHGFNLYKGIPFLESSEYLHSLIRTWVAHIHLHKKPIQLSLWQGEGALSFYGILSRKHHKGAFQYSGVT